MASVSGTNYVDGDSFHEDLIQQQFRAKYRIFCHQNVIKGHHIPYIAGNMHYNCNFMIGRTDKTADIYKLSNTQLDLIERYFTSNNIIGVRACSSNENVYYIGSTAEIITRDTRTPMNIAMYSDTCASRIIKSMHCFDLSSNGFTLAVGTKYSPRKNHISAEMLFWDVRQSKQMGTYHTTHTMDITQLHFHPTDPDKLVSGSVDGFINIYDLKGFPHDPLVKNFNTNGSVVKLRWFGRNADSISCQTYWNDLQLWNVNVAIPHAIFVRSSIAFMMRRKTEQCVYIADTFVNQHGYLSVLAGSNFKQSLCLRGFEVDGNNLASTYNFKENNQIVRCGWFNHVNNILVTAGESGAVDIWRLGNYMPASQC